MERKKMAVLRSYRDAAKMLAATSKEDAYDYLIAVLDYGLDDIQADLKGAAGAMFLLTKPNLDTSLKMSDGGSKGGTTSKPTESLTEALPKPTESLTEQEIGVRSKEIGDRNNTHPTLPREVLDIAGLRVADNARMAQETVRDWFSQHGYSCKLEVPVPDRGDGYTGRIDLLATKGSVQIAVEIDRVSAREKSLFKLRQFGCPRVVLVRNGTSKNINFADDGTAIIPLYATKSDGFDEFWSAYPKKVAKQSAKKAFESVKVPLETLLSALERQKCSEQWSKDGGQFIPNPATWLNQGRWEDELPEKSSGKKDIPKGASGDLGEAELEAIRRVLNG